MTSTGARRASRGITGSISGRWRSCEERPLQGRRPTGQSSASSAHASARAALRAVRRQPGRAARATTRTQVEVIVVDGLADRGAAARLRGGGRRTASRSGSCRRSRHPGMGPYRLTGNEYDGAASARNTGIVCAAAPYVVFQDDCSIVMSGWWRGGSAGGREETGSSPARATATGAWWSTRRRSTGSRAGAAGIDRRWRLGATPSRCGSRAASWRRELWRAAARFCVEINGFDELCDPIGVEVAQLGRRLELGRNADSLQSADADDPERANVTCRMSCGGSTRRSTPPTTWPSSRISASRTDSSTAPGRARACSSISSSAPASGRSGNDYELALLEEADLVASGEGFRSTTGSTVNRWPRCRSRTRL